MCFCTYQAMKTSSVLIQAVRYDDLWESEGIVPRLNLNIRWKWVVSFTHWPLYPCGKSTQYPLNRRLDGPQSQSGCNAEEKNSLPTRNPNPGHPAHSLVTMVTELPWILLSNLIDKSEPLNVEDIREILVPKCY